MDELCLAVTNQNKVTPVCLYWISETISHCTELFHTKPPFLISILRMIKYMFFGETSTNLMGSTINIKKYPTNLTLSECHNFVLKSLENFVEVEAEVNITKRFVSFFVHLIVFFLIFLLITEFFKLGYVIMGYTSICNVFGTFKRSRNYTSKPKGEGFFKRSKRKLKIWMSDMDLDGIAKPEEMLNSDGTVKPVIVVPSKANFVGSIVARNAQNIGGLYRMQEMIEKSNSYQYETAPKVYTFTENPKRKLNLILVFDGDDLYEFPLPKKHHSSSPIISPRSKKTPTKFH